MNAALPRDSIPSLARRVLDLQTLGLPGAQYGFAGRELQFRASIAPGNFGRLYDCRLTVKADAKAPELHVIGPDLRVLAGSRTIPHIYPSSGEGTKLCLWWPQGREWHPMMRLSETFIPWTAEWLHYFERWPAGGEWLGGGEHPRPRIRRWSGTAREAIR